MLLHAAVAHHRLVLEQVQSEIPGPKPITSLTLPGPPLRERTDPLALIHRKTERVVVGRYHMRRWGTTALYSNGLNPK